MIADPKIAPANVQWAKVTYQGVTKRIYDPASLLSDFMKQIGTHFADRDVQLMWDD
jgi:hypothetical protein